MLTVSLKFSVPADEFERLRRHASTSKTAFVSGLRSVPACVAFASSTTDSNCSHLAASSPMMSSNQQRESSSSLATFDACASCLDWLRVA